MSLDPFQSRQLPIVYEENDPYRIVKKTPHKLGNYDDYIIVHTLMLNRVG